MKTIYLTKSILFIPLLAASSVALAKSDYPEDFTPQIVYQDKDYIAEHGGSSQSTSTKKSKSTSSSSKYPGDFEPVILYQDKAYISKSGNSKSSNTRKSSSSAPKTQSRSENTVSTSTAAETADAAPSESGMSQYFIGLLVLVAAGFYLLKRPADSSESAQSSAPAAAAPSGSTGVANYLREHQMAEPTGVAKYLEQQTVASATGVEKYLRDHG